MNPEGEPLGNQPENLEPGLPSLDAKVFKDVLIAHVIFSFGCTLGSYLAVAGRELDLSWRLTLLGAVVGCATAGGVFLAEATRKGLKYLESSPEGDLPLSKALGILKEPIEDKKVLSAIRRIMQESGSPALTSLPSLPLLPDNTHGEEIILQEGGRPVGSLTVRNENKPEAALMNLSEEQIKEVEQKLTAVERVIDETRPGGEHRRALFGDVKRGWILETLIPLLRMGGLLVRLPWVIPLVRVTLVAALKEGSPPVLEKTANLLETLFFQLIEGEKLRNKRIRVSTLRDPRYTQLQTLATIYGLTIPATLEEEFLREEREKDKAIETASLIETGPFKAEELEDLLWVLAAINLRAMPEVRERAEKMIPQLIDFWGKAPPETIKRLLEVEEGRNPFETREKLAEAKERILKILKLAQEVPHLGFKPSIYQLAESLKLEGASREFIFSETLGWDESLGLITLVTLPLGEKISLNASALILTRAALACPFSPFFALSRGELRRTELFKAERLNPPTIEEIEMLFAGEEVLDWLLTDRNPAVLSEMNLIRQEPVDSQETKMLEATPPAPALVLDPDYTIQ